MIWWRDDTGGGWGSFPRQKRLAAKKLTDDDRNAFAATDAEHIMIMKVMMTVIMMMFTWERMQTEDGWAFLQCGRIGTSSLPRLHWLPLSMISQSGSWWWSSSSLWLWSSPLRGSSSSTEASMTLPLREKATVCHRSSFKDWDYRFTLSRLSPHLYCFWKNENIPVRLRWIQLG